MKKWEKQKTPEMIDLSLIYIGLNFENQPM